MQVTYGIRKGLEAHGYGMILGTSDPSIPDELRQIKVLIAQRVDGLIVMPLISEEDYLSPIRDFQIPLVFIDRRVKGQYGDCVLCDNFQGSYDAVAALIRQGHRKIGIIVGSSQVTTYMDRLSGYKSALADAGLEADDHRIMLFYDHHFDEGARLMQKMIKDGDVTAIFVADNLMALGGLSYINVAGLSMPQDISLVAFDDFEWELAVKPTISTVRQTPYELGFKAAQLLLERIANPDKPFETCILATRFVLRDSVSTPGA